MKVINQVVNDKYAMYHGDCVEVIKEIPDESIHYSLFSPPFASLFTYSDSKRDMGNCKGENDFAEHFSYIVNELFRITLTGRLISIHCMDLPASLTHDGFIGFRDFPGHIIRIFEKAGFIYHSRVCIWKDPLIQATRTKQLQLAHKQISKDSSMCAQGLPDYIITMRKPGSNPEPISHGRGFEQYFGEMPEPRDEKNNDAKKNKYSHHVWQRYASPVWFDIRQTYTLNTIKGKNDEKHICLAKDSLVLTKRGFVEIQNLNTNDFALTHNGRWKKILAVKNTGIRETINIKAQGVPSLTLTPEHKLWTRLIPNNSWSISHSRKVAKEIKPSWVEAKNICKSYINQKVLPDIDLDISKKELWLIGRWIADGHVEYRGHSYVVSIGFDKLDEFKKMVGNHYGAENKLSAMQVRLIKLSSKTRDILSFCGSKADNKEFPISILSLPKDKAKIVLDGYLSGDGHYLKERDGWSASTVSKKLALGLSLLIQKSYNSIASVYAGRPERKHVIEGRTVNAKQEWIIAFDIPNKYRYNKLPFILDDGAWKKVRSISDANKQETWSVRVEDDESFTAEGCIVKNCPLQLDTIARCLELWTNKNDIVFSPFAGVGSEGYQALNMNRRFVGIELKEAYYKQATENLKKASGKTVRLKSFF